MRVGPQAEKFGAFVVAKLHDASIDFFDRLAQGHWKAPRLQALQAALATFTDEQRAIVRRSVLAVLETGLHNFLTALDEARYCGEGIAVVVDGCDIAEQSDGLSGELYGETGWLARYRKHGGFTEPE
ncbi:MAG TPA: hypothetical protein VKD72_29410 [Gemmataceae bacterium]|nr:hypothetical protein [Gemmataceae bacterium]